MIWILILMSLVTLTVAEEVTHRSTLFGHAPSNIFYFKNSEAILMHESGSDRVWRSGNQGQSWETVPTVPESGSKVLIQHAYDGNRAYVLVKEKHVYRTVDQGKSWISLDLPAEPYALAKDALQFHASRAHNIIFLGKDCSSNLGYEVCHSQAFYSENDGQTWVKLRSFVKQCLWGQTEEFQALPVQSIFCTEWADKSEERPIRRANEMILSYTENFFSTSKTITFDESQQSGVIGFGFVKRFLVIAVKPKSHPDLDLYISIDGMQFFNSKFPFGTGIQEDAYTILESSDESLVVDVFQSRGYNKEYGSLYRSSSDGRYFVKSLDATNRNPSGIVDYEKVQGVEGIVLSNIVSNPSGLSGALPEVKRIETRISFDDGASWRFLSPPERDVDGNKFSCYDLQGSVPNEKCALHVHSITSPHNKGFVFSDAGVPGVIIAIGNVGDYLLPYEDCDTFVSTDSGISWRMVRKGAHKYETGDMGGLFVLIDDENPSDTITYSTDFGHTWHDYNFGLKLRVKIMMADPESTSRRIVVMGSEPHMADKFHIVSLDFNGMFDRKCAADDFEMWRARSLNEDSECLLGHYQEIERRKPDARCYVGRDYKIPEMKRTNCKCTAENFECDFGYISDNGKCVASGSEIVPPNACKNGETSYDGSSGYRRIPGDTCIDGTQLDARQRKDCKSVSNPGTITSTVTSFTGQIVSKYYIPESSVLILKDVSGMLWRSDDEGATFSKLKIEGRPELSESFSVVSMHLHEVAYERIYLFMSDDRLYYSSDHGAHFSEIHLPMKPNHIGAPLLDFHPTEKDWLIFVGGTDCPNCHTEVYVSQNNGGSWSGKVDDYVQKCVFAQDKEFKRVEKDAIYCSAYFNKFGSQDTWNGMASTPSGNHLVLYKLDNFGNGQKHALADRVVQFYVYERFLAAAVEQVGGVKLLVSVDGNSFAEVQFPPEVHIDKNAFTILQSRSGSIFLDVSQSTNFGSEYGMLFSSNSNGTYYSTSLKNTNINSNGIVDFEQMQSVDGIIFTNVVSNPEDVRRSLPKRVRSMITYNDGGSWKTITAPSQGSDGKSYDCGSECFLHLHGRTEISWAGPILSSPSIPGLTMGVGNVGSYMTDYSSADTFLSRDGGLTWIEVRKGPHTFEFGNYGSLLVMVSDSAATDKLVYSWDHGKTWSEYKFHDSPIRVSSLTIEPSASSNKFILFGFAADSKSGQLVKRGVFDSISDILRGIFFGGGLTSQLAIQVDLSGLSSSECVFHDDGSGDYEKWNPSQTDCVLGQEWTYWRRKSDSKCRIPKKLDLPTLTRTCECTAEDYECDVGFWRDVTSGKCELVGRDYLEPAGCREGEDYAGRSGYRKIAMTKCNGRVSRYEDGVTRKCSGRPAGGGPVVIPPSDGKVGVTISEFDNQVDSILWFDKTPKGVLRTDSGEIYRSENSGSSWLKFDTNGAISHVTQNEYFKQRVYLLSTRGVLHFKSVDNGATFDLFKVPAPLNTFHAPLLEFHAEEPDWIIFTGSVDCPGSNCRSVAYVTQDNGDNWREFNSYVLNCQWGRDAMFKQVSKSVVYCHMYSNLNGDMYRKFGEETVMCRSSDFFQSRPDDLAKNLVGFAISEKYMVVGADPEGKHEKLQFIVSVDGQRFVDAKFPPSVDPTTKGFTVLESASGSIFLDMSMSNSYDHEYGELYISNWNGTYYTFGMEGTNRSPEGYVDFERMLGLEGVSMINQVSNLDAVKVGETKKLRSLITYDDGLNWTPFPAPRMDYDNRPYSCSGDSENCNLHLQGYTERHKVRNELSDESAVGIFIGVGNVGPSLQSYELSNTYLTRNAGRDWTEIMKGPHLFEFGDHGSAIVLVHARDPVNYVWYSVSEGAAFEKYVFHESKSVYINRIVTDPSGTKQSFVLIGRDPVSSKGVTITLDFSKLRNKKCVIDADNQTNSDFELWSLLDHRNNSCVFGHVTQYYRRKLGRDCYIGEDFTNAPQIVSNCQCTESDYECDSGFFRDKENKCVMMSGLTEVWSECEKGSQYLSSGYRKHSLSTCYGGLKLDAPLQIKYCSFGMSVGGTWGLVLGLSVLALGGLGLYFYFFGKPQLGRIRIGDHTSTKWDFLSRTRDFVQNLFTDIRARAGYRPVPGNDSDVFLDEYTV